MATPDPFLEDSAVCAIAERFDLELSRYEAIEITDEKAIKGAGWVKQTPDYTRIRKALRDGVAVEGARVGAVKYTLSRKENSNA